ncbi:MAG: hypothetical protein VX899_10565 [Myxococcota bacterium]|nr:hypothetical protein [Myxococcota bacterium]
MSPLLLCWLSSTALAQQAPAPAPVVVWVERQLPEEKTLRKVARLAGGEPTHYSGRNLSFPPAPWSSADEQAYTDLSRAVESGHERFEEFEVELSIAQEVMAAVEQVGVIRDETDRAAIVEAMLLVGAAVDLAFVPQDLENSGQAKDLRLELPGIVANKALLSAAVLEPEKTWVRSDLRTGSAYKALLGLVELIPKLATGTLKTGELPADTQVIVDGHPTPVSGGSLKLHPGHHWVHVLVDGVITGRGEVDIYPGTPTEMPRLVDDSELTQADRRVSVGAADGLPADVVQSIALLSGQHPGAPVFLASLDPEGKLSLVPYSDNAVVTKPQAVTFTLGAEVGGGAVATPAFRFTDPDEPNTDTSLLFAPAAQGAFDLELGIYNLAILGGVEVNITPTRNLPYGVEGQQSADQNLSVPVYVKGYGGLGVYLIRPNKVERPTLLVAGQYGYFSPGWMGYGGRVTLGIPMRPGSWFKFSLVGFSGEPIPAWKDAPYFPENTPLISGGLRLGFQSTF